MRKLVLSVLISMQTLLAFAQSITGVTGKVVDAKNQRPMVTAEASILNTNFSTQVNLDGVFTFSQLSKGEQVLIIKSTGYSDQIIPLNLTEGQLIDLGLIQMIEDISSESQLGLITITENDLGDDNSGSENTAGLLQASRDAFQQAAAFNWGQARFRIRGLDNEYSKVYINGVEMNKIYDGRPQWSNWGGLNDATRNQEFTTGTTPTDYGFGGILGTQHMNTRASIFRKGTRVSFSGTNTNYNWRTMATHNSGLMANGWAYSVSASRRWAQEGFFEGTDYGANSFFAAVEKRIGDKHAINFTSILAQNSRGKNSPNTQEVTDIAGVEYNSYWGWQNGKKRNSRDKDVQEPILILSHYWKISDRSNLQTNVSFQTGTVSNSRIDYQNAPNPDPTYYRNLPSYYTSQYNGLTWVGGSPENQALAANALFLSNRQIDWDRIYQTNQNTADGNSVYVLYEDRTDDTQWSANTLYSTQLTDNIAFNGGATFRSLRSHNYQYLADLLGGSFYYDIDPFGNNEQQQADINNPNRTVVEGDQFGYNYNLNADVANAFAQFKFNFKKFDFYAGGSYIRSEYQRDGKYRNGYYPNHSYGKSEKVVFDDFGAKAGVVYKITGQHYLSANGTYMTQAPSLRNVFPNTRLNNFVMEDAVNEKIMSVDGSYVLRMPKLKARLTGYYSKLEDATETSFYYGEGIFEDVDNSGTSDAFVAESVTGINKKYMGGEFGIEYQLSPTVKITGTAAYGQYTYDNNPTVQLTQDSRATLENPNPLINYGTAALKNYRLPGAPQEAYSLGIEYRSPKFWWIGGNANYLDKTYVDVAPIMRTNNFYRNPTDPFGLPFGEATEERAAELLKQEQFDSYFLFNLQGGKSWRVDGTTIGFFASINNVLDHTYKTGGFEQARNSNFRELNQDVSSGTPSFGTKYFYGYGRTYFVNFYVQF